MQWTVQGSIANRIKAPTPYQNTDWLCTQPPVQWVLKVKRPECGALPPSPSVPSWHSQLQLYFCLTAVNHIHFPFLLHVLVPSVDRAVRTTALSASENPLQVLEARCSYPASMTSCWIRRTTEISHYDSVS